MTASTHTAGEHATALLPLPRPDRRIHSSRVKSAQGVVKSVRHLTYDTVEIIVKCDWGSPALNARAGQYATLMTEELDKPRSFSFARAPSMEASDEYTFFVRKVEGGAFSEWLFGRDRTGAPITICAPLGKFFLDETSKTIVAIAGGSGMSAILALLQDAAHRKVKRDCLFLYGGRAQRDVYCAEEIAAVRKNWAPRHTFESVMVLSEEPRDSGWTGARGFVTDYLKTNYLQTGKLHADKVSVYFCGPPPMVEAGIKVLAERAVAREDIHYDKFEDSTSPAPVIDNKLCVLCDECLLVKPIPNCIVEVAGLKPDGGAGKFSAYERIDPAYTSGLYYNTLYIDSTECIRCYACVEACPVGAISPHFDTVPQTLRQTVDYAYARQRKRDK
jgi:NAD(P)H-flavin reductase/NAD-dependent dihydropyrimidine dehydrogenase PreA subunit